MKANIKFRHRQPYTDWTNSNNSIACYLQSPVEGAETIAHEVFSEVCHLRTDKPPSEAKVNDLVHKSKIVWDYLQDVSELLDQLELTESTEGKGGES